MKEILKKTAKRIQIEESIISQDSPTFVVAEAACNHMCQMELTKKMIDKAAEAGADAIKFQTYKAEKLVTGNAFAFWGEDKISQIEYYRRLDRYGKSEYAELFAYARAKGIIAFSSPFDDKSTDMLADLGMSAFKIASCDITNIHHLRHVASIGRPIILSTGASTFDEIDKAIETILKEGNYQLALLACTLSYPTRYEDANLLRIKTLKERYPDMVIGISDHTEPDPHMVVPSIAVALGARIVEKHYTFDRSMTGSGHFFAVSPDDLKKMVQNIRLAEKLFGDGTLGVAESEKKAWQSARRSIVAEVPIRQGEVITEKMIGFKRPADGVPANMADKIVGRRAKHDIMADQQITFEMID